MALKGDETLADLRRRFAGRGSVEWIGLRLTVRGPLQAVNATEALAGLGLEGDHAATRRAGGRRQVTLVQAEHLPAIAALAGLPAADPAALRRNLVVRGINLLALRDRRFRIGDAVLEGTGLCHPCSRMEETLGPGGWNAVRGHGGITARVLTGGRFAIGDTVEPLEGRPGEP